mmetsp:Transcript_91452/g.289959  ORF Transcript_91452/g.289959 Transcript_91452/m.289959 type:complete len:240 (-) Transcript_91452:89-808(-)
MQLQAVGRALHVLEDESAVAREGGHEVPDGPVGGKVPDWSAGGAVQATHLLGELMMGGGVGAGDHDTVLSVREAAVRRELRGHLCPPHQVAGLDVDGKDDPVGQDPVQGTVHEDVRVHGEGRPRAVHPPDLPLRAELADCVGRTEVDVALMVDDCPEREGPKPSPWVRPLPGQRSVAQLEGSRVVSRPAVGPVVSAARWVYVRDLPSDSSRSLLGVVVHHPGDRGLGEVAPVAEACNSR